MLKREFTIFLIFKCGVPQIHIKYLKWFSLGLSQEIWPLEVLRVCMGTLHSKNKNLINSPFKSKFWIEHKQNYFHKKEEYINLKIKIMYNPFKKQNLNWDISSINISIFRFLPPKPIVSIRRFLSILWRRRVVGEPNIKR